VTGNGNHTVPPFFNGDWGCKWHWELPTFMGFGPATNGDFMGRRGMKKKGV
jgi:hypothetical protein